MEREREAGPLYRFSIRDAASLKAMLEWFLRRATWNDNGGYSIENFQMDELGATHALDNAVATPADLPHVLKRQIVGATLAEWYRSSRNPADTEAFQRALQAASLTFQQTSQPFLVLTLWNLGLGDREAIDFEVKQTTTRIGSWTAVQDFPLQEMWLRAVRFWHSGPPMWLRNVENTWAPVSSLVPAITEVRAPDFFGAISLTEHSIELVRAALNLPRALPIGLRFAPLPAPLGAVIPMPLYAVLRDNRELVDVAFGLDNVPLIARVDLTANEIVNAHDLLQQCESHQTPDIAAYKSKLLRLYQAALDSADRQSQFLAFWQVLEAATLVDPGSRDQVEKRLITLLELQPDAISAHIARALASIRHELVHSGTFPVDDAELPFVAKRIADRTLTRAFRLVDTLGGVAELRDFFPLATKGDSDLMRLSKVALHIAGRRN